MFTFIALRRHGLFLHYTSGVALSFFPMGIDLWSLLVLITFWQSLHILISHVVSIFIHHPSARAIIPDKSKRLALLHLSPPYFLSTLHALQGSIRGIHHLYILYFAPPLVQLIDPPISHLLPEHKPFLAEIQAVLTTNSLLASYLIVDFYHVLRLFPKVGGYDMILHHFAFAGTALIAGWYHLYPFMFGWLILGEASTIFLNLRWLLIKAGRANSSFFRFVETSFALVFVVTRFFLYLAGLLYHFSTLHNVLDAAPHWAIYLTTGFVTSGFLINLTWLRKMFRIFMGTNKPPSPSSASAVRNRTQ